MQRLLVIDRNLLAALDVAQRKEQNVTIECPHVRVGLAGVIYVMRSITTSCPIQTAVPIDITDAQDPAIAGTLSRLELRNPLARILGNLLSTCEPDRREAALPVDCRLPY